MTKGIPKVGGDSDMKTETSGLAVNRKSKNLFQLCTWLASNV